MAEVGLTFFDGTHLSHLDVSPLPCTHITGADLLELAQTTASQALFGFVLPESLKAPALRRIGVSEIQGFHSKQLSYSDACETLRNYISAIADQLKDDPIAATILDGKSLHMFLEDEDDFAMLAENLFTDLDVEDRGKISKDEIQSALTRMGIESGVPPVSEFPELKDILKKHGAAGKEELGQAQFAQLLQPVLQQLADCLAKTPVVIALPNIKLANGSKLKKLLGEESLPDVVVEEKEESRATKMKEYVEKHGVDFGLPPSQVPEMVVLLDEIFNAGESDEDDDSFRVSLKKILEKIADKLEANPILYDVQNPQP